MQEWLAKYEAAVMAENPGGEKPIIGYACEIQTYDNTGMLIQAMRNAGIFSTNGSHFGMGGLNPDTLYLHTAGNAVTVQKIVPANLRSGAIPFQFGVNLAKTSVLFGSERLTQVTVKATDVHQLVFDGGVEGMGLSQLVITGIPDPVWFKEFLEAK